MRAAGLSCEARSSTSEVGMCVAESNAVDGDVRCALVCERIANQTRAGGAPIGIP
jgi:hypothetical protein